jgi:5-methylcytosine-specific restriction endonuclease McrA
MRIMKIVYYNGWVDKYIYLRIINLYKYNGILTCELCKEPINDNNIHRRLSIDHIIPQTKGGNGNIENLRITHRKCNSDRILK